jgi:chloramphenicol-sensitive protein RarD
VDAPPPASEEQAARIGAAFAVAAYTLWGLFPLYWKLLDHLPLVRTLGHRVVWTLATVLLILLATRRFADLRRALGDRRKALTLGLSGLLIGANWSLYIYAIDSGQILQASLGYYVNPLMSVGLGVLLLRERLNRAQVFAVLLAAGGVILVALEHTGMPLLALSMAVTFSLYSYVKKRLDVPPLAGLGAETLFMLPVALAALRITAPASGGLFPGPADTLLLVGSGAITLAPLFCFNGAARRLRLATLGFFQYLSPSLQLVLAVVLYGEPFTGRHWGAFGLIWAGLLVYSADSVLGRDVTPSRGR